MSRSRTVRAAALASTIAIVAGACGGSPRFTREDIDRIVLTPVDAPEGTAYSRSVSGIQGLAVFARDAEEAEALEAEGFQIGHLALFAPAAASEPDTSERLPDDAPFVQGITGLFGSPEGASSALRRFVDDLRTRQLDAVADLDPLALGDESYAVQGEASDTHLVMYAWRDDNLILAVGGAGRVEVETVRALARQVGSRAVDAAG